jgi:hypothetical protein
MAKLQDFIAKRAREIEELLEPLRRQAMELEAKIKTHEKELGELRNAAKAIGIVNRLERPLGITRKTSPPRTIKEAVLDVLQDYPGGLIALDILAKINERFSMNLVRTSLSPQLSRLKQEGKILNHGSTWLPRHQNDEGSAT